MHERFEGHLELLSELAQKEIDKESAGENDDDLQIEVGKLLHRQSKRRDSDVDSQNDIYELQLKKQKAMAFLHESLSGLDDPDAPRFEQDTDAIPVTYRDGKLIAIRQNGEEELTEGEIYVGGDFGVRYDLDPSVPRPMRKRYIIEDVKRDLVYLRDSQIFADERSSSRVHEFTKNAYASIMERRDVGSEQTGVIAEQVIASMFKRLQYDADLDFTFEEADIYQDVREKIDFIIRRNRGQRNVTVEESDDQAIAAAPSGIQFTVNRDPGIIEHKQEQIARAKQWLESDTSNIQDVLLVQLSGEASNALRSAYNQFREGKSAHSVDTYIPQEVKRELFFHVLQDIFTPERIEEQWKKLEDRELAAV